MKDLLRSREFEASIIIVKHDFDLSEIATELMQGFRITALSSGLRQKDLESLSDNIVLRYFRNAAESYAIVAALHALNSSSRLEVKSYLQTLGFGDVAMQMWERVLSQYKVPSALTELFRLSYSPVVLNDGTIMIALPRDLYECNSMEYLFTQYEDTLIAKLYTSSLAPAVRTSAFDMFPMVYQHLTAPVHVDPVYRKDTEYVVNRSRVDAAVLEYARYIKAGKKGKLSVDAQAVRKVAEDKDIEVDSLSEKLEYQDFKYKIYDTVEKQVLVTPAVNVPSGHATSDVMFPQDMECLFASGQIFGCFSKITKVQQLLIRDIINSNEDWEVIQPSTVIGFSNLETTVMAPIVIDRSLVCYAIDRITQQDMKDWWLKTFMETNSKFNQSK